MTDPEEIDEDLFADLYEGDEADAKPTNTALAVKPVGPPAVEVTATPETTTNGVHQQSVNATAYANTTVNENAVSVDQNGHGEGEAQDSTGTMRVEPSNGWDTGATNGNAYTAPEYEPVGIKEDGKMFIGGLNWETTDQSLRDYFSQFGEVLDCNVMRDGASGRSRGFGFLTFKDPRTVNIVMVKEHYLDGKIIDPKRAIPREEQERTSKIFVGGVSQEATERDFKEFFMKFGRVVDATLMMDKDTGRPRGFGFVTFDGDAAVDATLSGPLQILGKPIEVKRAQPRGNLDQDDGGRPGKFNRHNHRHDRFQRDNDRQGGGGYDNQANQAQEATQGMNNSNNPNNNLSPQMMAQYWQRMQQYFAMMQQQMAAGIQQGQGMSNQMGMAQMNPQMNPAMMQQMQQMMAMQQGMGRAPGMSPGGSPHPQSPAPQAMLGMPPGISPAMMQQMQQMQQMQMQQQQAGYPGMAPAMTPVAPVLAANRPGFNAQEQLAFEQRKYEQQQARRMQPAATPQYPGGQYPGQGGPTSWEGMYDDVPQPNLGGQGGGGRGMGGSGKGGMQQNRGSQGPSPQPQGAAMGQAPANAPTGPKNAGKPGANYRGGGRAGRQGFHPYSRG